MAKLNKLAIVREFARRNGGAIGKVRVEGEFGAFTIQRDTGDAVSLPAASVEYLVEFGLQSLQDAYAGKTTDAESRAAFDAKYAKLVAGDMSAGAAKLPLADRVAIDMAALTKSGKVAYAAIGKDVVGRALTNARLAIARDMLAKHEAFRKAVDAETARRSATETELAAI